MSADSQNSQKRIHVLDKRVSELIAAGEVVERPASAVKELLENAIDAGATMITLEIKNGGVAFMRVTDNGSGILHEDVSTAFLRHATSKVRTEDDLTAIGTLGFRGEALASISAVSKVELITRTADELAGTHIKLEGGEIVENGDAGCPQGTTIVVRELFFNTPARMKFLKKDSTEGNAVAAVAQRLALSHPEVSLRFIKDGREEIHTPGDNKLISAIHSVLGREFAGSLLKTDYTLGHVHAAGFVTKPLAARPNRNMQFFFLNGRLVKSKTMMAALEEAYKNSVMSGKHPGCVLHIECNPSLADINVHPAKLEVRFVNEKEIFEAVYYATKNALAADNERPTFDITEEKHDIGTANITGHFAEKPVNEHSSLSNNFNNGFAKTGSFERTNNVSDEQLKIMLQSTPLQPEKDDTPVLHNSVVAAYEPVTSGRVDIEIAADDLKDKKAFAETEPAGGKVIEITHAKAEITAENKIDEDVKVVGECFGTYILAQMGGSLWIIDKHAAHERILYEDIKNKREAASQVLLEPAAVTLPAEEYSAVLDNLELLAQAGISVEDFGGSTILVREASLDLTGQDIPTLVSEIAGALISHKKDLTPARLDWVYHSVACRAAIKAGDHTTIPEMENLSRRVLLNNDIRFCPHGRPVAFELPRADIEKKFGR